MLRYVQMYVVYSLVPSPSEFSRIIIIHTYKKVRKGEGESGNKAMYVGRGSLCYVKQGSPQDI